MPLNFILGRSGSGKTTHCINQITANLSNSNISMFYIVQEQETLQAERILANATAYQTVIGAQALSFKRLAYHVFTRSGGVPTKQLNDTGKHILLRKILQECNLTFYSRAINMAGFIESLAQTVTEFAEYEILPSDLESRAARAAADGNINMASKLTDLAVIFRKYTENIAGKFLVADETLKLLVDALETSDYLDNTIFWIDGFKFFTPQEISVIRKLLQISQNVTITLTMDNPPQNGEPPKLSDFFYTTKQTFNLLKTKAAELNIPVNTPILLDSPQRHKNNWEFLAITNHFAKSQANYSEPPQAVKIVPSQDKWAELTLAAKWVKSKIAAGYKFNDIAIACGDLSSYEKLAKNIFETHEIPLFVDNKPNILLHPLTELIRAAIDVVVWDWQYESVFRLLKTGFTDIPIDEIDILENYVLARGIKSWRWKNRWRDLNETRQKVIETLAPFSDGLRPDKKMSVTEISLRIYNWLYKLDVPSKLAKLLESAAKEDGGDQEQALWHKQIWRCISEVFDKLVEILGDETVTIKMFSEILDAVFKSEDLGLIPPTLEQVILGDAKRSHYPEIKALWILGANDGQLPMPEIQNTLITDDEREILRSFNLKLSPDIPHLTNYSMMALHSILCKPKDELVLSYSRTSLDGKQLRPSTVLLRLKKIFTNLQEESETTENAENIENTETVENSAQINDLSKKYAEILYGDSLSTFVTNATHLESYSRCPFSYFMQYNLQARPREIYRVKPTDLGNMYHDIIAQVVTHLTQNNAWETANRTNLEQLVQTFAELHLEKNEYGGSKNHVLHSNARNMYILQSAKNICTVSLWALCEQYRRGTFKISSIEEKSQQLDILLESQKKMSVTGRIDRVDTLAISETEREYVKIIDYKSGKAKFSLNEVLAGRQLQLMLYLNTFLQNSKVKPGGVFYFNIDDPIIKEDSALSQEERDEKLLQEFKLSGLVLGELHNIFGLDKTLQSDNKRSSIIPVEINKDGEFSKKSSVANREEFKQLCNTVTQQAAQIGTKMTNGTLQPSPSNKISTKHCNYCNYKSTCGFANF
ncbi:MAG: PD-(D/E)XK nuclease family protein [Firmicutes bacterium]|nr:PD-(D/E)XK nuclease family protein [Bacillota bacterium]